MFVTQACIRLLYPLEFTLLIFIQLKKYFVYKWLFNI